MFNNKSCGFILINISTVLSCIISVSFHYCDMKSWLNQSLMLYKPFYCRSPWVHPDFIYGLTANGRENKRLTKYVHNFADEIIQSRRTALVRI